MEETVPNEMSGMKIEQVDTFRVTVVAGPDLGKSAISREGRLILGRHEGATLRLTDRTVSQFHLELEIADGGVRARDLESSNGTFCQSLSVRDVLVRDDAEFSLGQTRVRLSSGGDRELVSTSTVSTFHGLHGASPAMRTLYARLQNAAPTSSTVLVLGESGTGKELAAHALHAASPRQHKAFEVVNCGSLAPTLIESELFGHVRGGFTGAVRDMEGAFERADGGTIFLDEIGELPLESQPKFLRVLEAGQIQRVGDTRTRPVNVRVVAATNRDLRAEVNAGRFRADLYYRLAVISVRMPALREHPEDLPRIAEALIANIRRERGIVGELPVDGALIAALRAHRWPGNVRELRNYLENWLVYNQQPEHEDGVSLDFAHGSSIALGPLLDEPLTRARESFERAYLRGVLERCDWQIVEAARQAGIDRTTLFRNMRRYQIERPK